MRIKTWNEVVYIGIEREFVRPDIPGFISVDTRTGRVVVNLSDCEAVRVELPEKFPAEALWLNRLAHRGRESIEPPSMRYWEVLDFDGSEYEGDILKMVCVLEELPTRTWRLVSNSHDPKEIFKIEKAVFSIREKLKK